MSESCVSCTLNAAQIQERRAQVLQPLKRFITAQTPLEDGYLFEFAANDESLNLLLRFIQLERECCTFLRFRLTVEPNNGPVLLEMTGPQGTKAFIEAEMELAA